MTFGSFYFYTQPMYHIHVESFRTFHRRRHHHDRTSCLNRYLKNKGPATLSSSITSSRDSMATTSRFKWIFKRKIPRSRHDMLTSSRRHILKDAHTFPTLYGSLLSKDNRLQYDDYDDEYEDYDDESLFEDEENPKSVLDWTWEPWNDIAQVYLPPPILNSTTYPKTILHFIGGTIFGSYPKTFYATDFLQKIARETHSILVVTAIPISLQANPLHHDQLAYTLAKAFRQVYQNILIDEYGLSMVKQMKIVGIGHSLGSRLHVILNTHSSSLRKIALKRHANILIAFNNYPSMASIPGISTLSKQIEDTRNEYLDDQDETSMDEEEEYDNDEEEDYRKQYRNSPKKTWDTEEEEEKNDDDDDEYFDQSYNKEYEDVTIEDIFSAMKKRVRQQISSLKVQLTPTSLLQDQSILEFQPSPDELWQRIQEGIYVKNVPKTLVVQFDQDSLDQSSRLAKSIYDSWMQASTSLSINETLLQNEWDIKFARLHGSHITPIMMGTSYTWKTLFDKITSWNGVVDRVLEESLKDYRIFLKQNQQTKKKTEQDQNDLIQSIIRYIIDIVQ